MRPYTALASRLAFPLHERLKGHASVRVRRALEASQWWPRARLEAFRLERMRTFLVDIGRNVPYYRDLFATLGFDAARLQSLDELAALPFLAKRDIRANTERLKSASGRPLSRLNTGGSSGEPLVFFVGKERVSHDVAAKWRATRWWGVDIGDPEIVVWGSPVELSTQDRLRTLRDRLLRSTLLPAFAMSEQRLDGFVDTIRRRRPRMLFGYPSSLSMIAAHAESRGIRLDDLGVVVAFVTSERLYDHQRAAIARVFGCRVANGYGGRDAGFIAHECPQGSMHLTAEDLHVEIVDAAGARVPDGTAGEIVVTHMATRDFPFVRYRTGDVGVLDPQPCACGRGLPLLKEIQGRTTDFVVAADGTVMHGLAVIYPIRDLAGIAAFRIVQETRTLSRVLVVPGTGYGHATEESIRSGIKQRLGQGVDVVVEPVSAIPPDPSGKFRYVKSLVTP